MEIFYLMKKSSLIAWVTGNWEFISIESWILIWILENILRNFRNIAVVSLKLGKHWEHLKYILRLGRMCPRSSNLAHFCMTSGKIIASTVFGCSEKKLVRIALWLPYRSTDLWKFEESKTCPVFELQLNELLKFSLSQKRNYFKILDIGSQQ